VLDELKTTKSKIAFILQLGYFKARCMFFAFTTRDVETDIKYVVDRCFSYAVIPDCAVSKITRLKHQRLILALCKYKPCDDNDRQQLEVKAREAATVSGKPVYVFRKILYFMLEQRIVSPAYSSLQDMIGKNPDR
jgi:hypothetical protein